jgi:hypothetical protein
MIAFEDSNGTKFRAYGAIGIVRQMRRAAWVTPGKRQYMADVAQRIGVLDNGASSIAVDSPEAFISSLVRYGWLKPVTP